MNSSVVASRVLKIRPGALDQLRINSQLPVHRTCGRGGSASTLLNHFFELRTEDTSVVAIKRDMEPITFLALDNEF